MLLCGVRVADSRGQGAEGAERAEGAVANMVQQSKGNYRHSTPGLRKELNHFTSSASTLEQLIAAWREI